MTDDSEPKAPTMSDERPTVEPVAESRFRRTYLFVRVWWKPVTVSAVLVVLSAWVGLKVSWLPVLWSAMGAGWFLVVMWWAVKVYYHRIMEVRYEPGSDEIMLARHLIPMDISPLIDISGPRGMVRDIYGNTYDITGKFDPETLRGEGTWPNNWTPLHVMSHMGMAWKIVRIAERTIWQHSQGRIRAEAEFLTDRAILAGLKDLTYYRSDGNVDKTELAHAIRERVKREKAQEWRESTRNG